MCIQNGFLLTCGFLLDSWQSFFQFRQSRLAKVGSEYCLLDFRQKLPFLHEGSRSTYLAKRQLRKLGESFGPSHQLSIADLADQGRQDKKPNPRKA